MWIGNAINLFFVPKIYHILSFFPIWSLAESVPGLSRVFLESTSQVPAESLPSRSHATLARTSWVYNCYSIASSWTQPSCLISFWSEVVAVVQGFFEELVLLLLICHELNNAGSLGGGRVSRKLAWIHDATKRQIMQIWNWKLYT